MPNGQKPAKTWWRAALMLGIALFAPGLGCSGDETPTSPATAPRGVVATVHIDSCSGYPPGEPWELDALCGASSEMRVSFDLVLADMRDEYVSSDGVVKKTTFRTGPGRWEFSNPAFRDVLLPVFDGRHVRIAVRRTIGAGSDETSVGMLVLAGNPSVSYYLRLWQDAIDMPLDAGGFPVMGAELVLSGAFSIMVHGGPYKLAEGNADVTIRNWNLLPVRQKPEPPVVARPNLTVQQLTAAPESLGYGDMALEFWKGIVYRSWGSQSVGTSIEIMERSLYDFDKARLDFLWVVHESGEIWEPDIPSAWDSHYLLGSAYDGPGWDSGTDAHVVVGFVDLKGEVSLMRKRTTVFREF